MTPERFGLLIAESALADGVPLGPELRRAMKPGAVAERASTLATAGDLPGALRALLADELLTQAVGAWPQVLGAGRRALERLPDRSIFRRPLALFAAYWFGVYLFQLGVLTMLRLKITPVFLKMAWDQSVTVPALDRVDSTVMFVLGASVVTWAIALVYAMELRLPGWPRWLARARQAALGAALLESAAPADVVASWLRGDRALEGAHDSVADDLRAVASACAGRAEAHAATLVIALRVTLLFLLVIQATVILLAVVQTISLLPLGFR